MTFLASGHHDLMKFIVAFKESIGYITIKVTATARCVIKCLKSAFRHSQVAVFHTKISL
jgi:hypothetical protein